MNITTLTGAGKWKAGFRLALALLAAVLAGCAPAAPSVTFTPTLGSATASPTPTIRWFPPTQTQPPFPTLESGATPEYHPGIGSLLFSDAFDKPDLWTTSTSAQAGAIIARQHLVLSFNGLGPQTVLSLRSQPALTDFYVEATAEVSLCSSKDEYGLVFRAAPGMNYYRFVVNCNGEARLELSRNGVVSPLQDWQASGDATFGAPAHVTLGVWVVGTEIRTFINDNFQFSAHDPLFRSGSIGFFVYASGKTAITASYSDLLVYSVDAGAASPLLLPTRTP
jgi:hypothetical protein